MSKAEEILKKHIGSNLYRVVQCEKQILDAMEEYASQPLPVGGDWRQGVEDFWNLCGFDHIADNRYWPQWVGIIEEIIREQTATLQAENTRLEELNKTLHSLMVSGEKRGYEKACQHFQETIGNQEMNLAHLAEENQHLREQLQAAQPPAAGEVVALTRVEVIDHYSGQGRVFIHWKEDSKIELDYQDGGKTLKVFISKATQTKGGTE